MRSWQWSTKRCRAYAELQSNDDEWIQALQALSSSAQKDQSELEHSHEVADRDALDESGGQDIDPAAGDAYRGRQDSPSRSDASDTCVLFAPRRRNSVDLDANNADGDADDDVDALDEADEKARSQDTSIMATSPASTEPKQAEDQQPPRTRGYLQPWQQSAHSTHNMSQRDQAKYQEAWDKWRAQLQILDDAQRQIVEAERQRLNLDPGDDYKACDQYNSRQVQCKKGVGCEWNHKLRCNPKLIPRRGTSIVIPGLVDRLRAGRGGALRQRVPADDEASFHNNGRMRRRESEFKQEIRGLDFTR